MDRTDSRFLKDLRKSLGKRGSQPVSLQAVQQRRAKLQAVVPMPTDVASYIIGQRAGMKLHSYLDEEKLDQIAKWEQRLSTKKARSSDVPPTTASKEGAAKRAAVVKELHLDQTKVPEAALSGSRRSEAERMAGVYPLLYVFENSVREFIDGHLTAHLGKGWYDDPKVVSPRIREIVERNKAAEGRHRYHSRRNASSIFYTDIDHLGSIIMSEKAWPIFKPMFPSDKWLAGVIEKIEVSRNVVAHNNPLQPKDIARLRMNLEDWLEQIKGHGPEPVS